MQHLVLVGQVRVDAYNYCSGMLARDVIILYWGLPAATVTTAATSASLELIKESHPPLHERGHVYYILQVTPSVLALQLLSLGVCSVQPPLLRMHPKCVSSNNKNRVRVKEGWSVLPPYISILG